MPTPQDAIRHSVVVDAPPDRAFQFFTGALGRWWPIAYTFAGPQFQTAAVEPHPGGRWFERAVDGQETGWGEVRRWAPPRELVLSFAITPDRRPAPPGAASEVAVRFTPEGTARTRIEVEHRDFERHGPEGGPALRQGMDSPQGWPLILAELRRALARDARIGEAAAP
ncbi:SRPBCC family protein [Myxococcus sp. Y35]|uniref:SRPBCC family protein n=1 Tax=Pseudomyxococcus flavus TaxID=3115648 RepID=UPI003CEF5C78